MSISQSLKKGITTTIKSVNVILVLFIFGLIGNIISLIIQPRGLGTAPALNATIFTVVFAIFYVLISVYLQGGSLVFIRDTIKSGKSSLGSFFKAGAQYYWRLVLIGAVVGVLVLVFILIDTVIFGLLANKIAVLAVSLVIFLAVIEAYFLILFFFAPYAAIIDEKKPMEAIRQSITCLRKGVSAILGVIYLIGFLVVSLAYILIPSVRKSNFGQSVYTKLVVLGTLLLVIGFLIGAVFGAAIAGLSLVIKDAFNQQLLFAIISSFANALIGLFMTASFMSFYLGMSECCKKEESPAAAPETSV